MTQRKELLIVAGVALGLVLIGFGIGRATAPATPARVVTVTQEKEKIVWRENKTSASETTATAAKIETVRVVTRWLRPDGTPEKEKVKEKGSVASAASSTLVASQSSASGATERASESRTVVDLRPRVFAQGLLGLDLGAGLERRWGGAVSVRIAGPVWVGAWVLPGMKVGGASVGVTW